MRSGFLETLNYASVNEDWRTEAEALRFRGGERTLCVTGSGDRALDLLPHDPGRIVAIDLVPAQSHLLRLKMVALSRLAYPEYAAFLGLTPEEEDWRWAVWRSLRDGLPTDARAFWDERREPLRAGILYQGRWERHYRRVARLARLLRPRLIRRLFAFRDLEAQRRFVRERWDSPLWRAAWRIVCSPAVSRLTFGDPAFYAHVAVSPGRVLYERMRASLERYLARENFMVSLALRGRLAEEDLPPYLTETGHALIRERLDRIEVVTADVVEYLEEPGHGPFDRFSLSDVPSYLGADDFNRFVAGVTRCAAPGARVCIRQFLTRYELPSDLTERWRRDRGLEARLAAEDRSFAYEFIVAEVAGAEVSGG
jgi:S-adenosylmethionine-diacylglycerol 3-amino-3-carboxypropyl transferase